MDKSKFSRVVFLILIFFLASCLPALAGEKPEKEEKKKGEKNDKSQTKEYQTPLSGDDFETKIFGKTLKIKGRDRSKTLTFNLGAFFTEPKVIDPNPLPVAAIFYKQFWKNQRIRGLFLGVLNQVFYGRDLAFDGRLEGLLTWENSTLPLPVSEYFQGRDFEDTEVYWGFLRFGLGLAYKKKVPPHHLDNILSLGLFYEPGFSYYDETEKTASDYSLPPETFEHRLHLRFRLDGFTRNLVELRHSGWALGVDGIWGKRFDWQSHGFSRENSRGESREYLLVKAFATAAFQVPFLNTRHRLVPSLYFGYSPHTLDRYSAFPLGGNPSADETEGLSVPILPGAFFREYRSREYFLANFEYRYEFLPFFYGHLRLSGGWMIFRQFRGSTRRTSYERTPLGAVGMGISTGFFFKSLLVLDYSYNWELKRRGERGTHLLVLRWTKSL